MPESQEAPQAAPLPLKDRMRFDQYEKATAPKAGPRVVESVEDASGARIESVAMDGGGSTIRLIQSDEVALERQLLAQRNGMVVSDEPIEEAKPPMERTPRQEEKFQAEVAAGRKRVAAAEEAFRNRPRPKISEAEKNAQSSNVRIHTPGDFVEHRDMRSPATSKQLGSMNV